VRTFFQLLKSIGRSSFGRSYRIANRLWSIVYPARVAWIMESILIHRYMQSLSSGFSPPTIDEVRTNEGNFKSGLGSWKRSELRLGYRIGKGKFNADLGFAYYFKLDRRSPNFYQIPRKVATISKAGRRTKKGIEAAVDYSFVKKWAGIYSVTWAIGTAYTGQFFQV